MLTFHRPLSLDLAQDVDATFAWGGVGWGRDTNVPSTTFPRPCTHGAGWGCWRFFDHVPSTLHKMLMLRARWPNYHRSGWDGAMITLTRPCTRLWCCAQDHDAAYPWCWYIIYGYDDDDDNDDDDDDPVELFESRGKWWELIVSLLLLLLYYYSHKKHIPLF